MTTFYGGGEEYIVRLVNCLENEFDIALICCSKFLSEKLKNNNVRLQLVAGSVLVRYFTIFFKMLRLPCKKQQVVLLNGQGPAYFALFLPKLFKKLVYVHHTSLEYYNDKSKQRLVIYCLQKVDLLICVSWFLKKELDRYIHKRPVKVIYNWLPKEAIQSIPYPADEGTLHLLFMARLVEVKGILPLVEIVDKLEGVVLSVLGDGPLYDQIKTTYGNSTAIRILGWQNDKASFYKKVHLNVVNSFSEGYSYTPVEAGVCGIPSLISDLEVHREISDNGRFAFLFKAGSVEDLKDKLIYLKNNRKVLEEMSCKCKTYYTEKFVLSDYKEQYKRELS